jgi:hypothetical protein
MTQARGENSPMVWAHDAEWRAGRTASAGKGLWTSRPLDPSHRPSAMLFAPRLTIGTRLFSAAKGHPYSSVDLCRSQPSQPLRGNLELADKEPFDGLGATPRKALIIAVVALGIGMTCDQEYVALEIRIGERASKLPHAALSQAPPNENQRRSPDRCAVDPW